MTEEQLAEERHALRRIGAKRLPSRCVAYHRIRVKLRLRRLGIRVPLEISTRELIRLSLEHPECKGEPASITAYALAHFQLQQESQGIPPGVQGDMFGARGLDKRVLH